MIIDSVKITNALNNYLTTIGEKSQAKIWFSQKSHTNNLVGENIYIYFIITPTDAEEFFSAMSHLNINKLTAPNSILTRILKSVKKFS